MTVGLRPAFVLHVEIAPARMLGATWAGVRRVIPITGGRFEGERLRGRVLPGGADWNAVRPDGVMHAWARYELETEDGALISVINDGLMRVTPEQVALLESGRAAEIRSWYARTSPRFETAAPQYRWLNESVFVGDLRPPTSLSQVVIDVHEVL